MILAALASVLALGAEAKDIYLLLGQSNMAGRGDLTQYNRLSTDRVEKLDKADRWVAATEPIHYDKPSAGAGLGMSFARLVADATGAEIGLVPCAVGGSALNEWLPGAHLYVEAMRRAKIAQKEGEIKAILWHQGESDADIGKLEASYNERLAKMVAAGQRTIRRCGWMCSAAMSMRSRRTESSRKAIGSATPFLSTIPRHSSRRRSS